MRKVWLLMAEAERKLEIWKGNNRKYGKEITGKPKKEITGNEEREKKKRIRTRQIWRVERNRNLEL
jgi:hypothetical protein